MAKVKCGNCGKSFTGRENRSNCSDDCRREIEQKRRRWDRWEDEAREYELLAIGDPIFPNTQYTADAYKAKAAEIRKLNGPRP